MIENYEVSASNETLLRQAPYTAELYMLKALEATKDLKISEASRAVLIASFMQTCAIDLVGAVIARSLDNLVLEVHELRALAEAMAEDE